MWKLLRAALPAVAVWLMMGVGCLREDELDCEEAVAHLQECCPGFARQESLQCVYTNDCGVTEPAISVADSQCIQGQSCAELVSSGICARALHLSSPSSEATSDDGASPPPPPPNMVCP